MSGGGIREKGVALLAFAAGAWSGAIVGTLIEAHVSDETIRKLREQCDSFEATECLGEQCRRAGGEWSSFRKECRTPGQRIDLGAKP